MQLLQSCTSRYSVVWVLSQTIELKGTVHRPAGFLINSKLIVNLLVSFQGKPLLTRLIKMMFSATINVMHFISGKHWFKGTVSRDFHWVLLYINRKLFSRAIVAHHKILILLKGHFTIYKRRSSIRIALQFLMVCSFVVSALF